MRRQMRARPRGGGQHRGAGIREHERKPLGRIIRVERQIGAPGLEDADKPHQHRQRALDAQPHHHLGPDPERAQVMRQPARARIELAVAQPLVLEHHRVRFRRTRNLRREQLGQGRTRNRPCGRVPLPQNGATLVRAQNVEPANRTLRIGNRSLQQPNQPPRNRLNARTIEQVAGVFQRSLDPRRTAVRTAPLRKAQRQVELRARRRNRLKAHAQSGKLQPKLRVVLQYQHHLEQRMTRQRARRVEHLHQTLERKLLVAVGRKVARTHPANKLTEARRSRRVRAQNKRVHEEPDKIVQRAVGAARNRAPDRNVVARTKPRQQRAQTSLQHHEQARPARARKLQQPSMQRPRQPQTNAPPAMARYRRTRTVERKIDLIRKPRKLAGPERQLARYCALAIILRSQNRMLPQRVISILTRQRRHRGRLPTAARLVKAPEIAQQRRQRPAVAGNVMQQQQNNVLAFPQRKHMHTQRRLARKIKARTRRRGQRSRKRGFAHRRYRKPRPRRLRIQDLLARNPERVGEDRAQALVTPTADTNRRPPRTSVQPPPRPQRQRDRVGRARTFQTVQEPQPPLRIRQRDLRRTRQRAQRRTRSLRIPQPLHQRLNRRSLEQAADRKLNIQRRADAADQTRRQQRMTPKRKEGVVDPHTLRPKRLRKQAAQDLLLRRARHPPHRSHRLLRRRQRTTVELAVGCQRKTIQHHKRRRHHVLGKAPPQMRTQQRSIRNRSTRRNNIANQPLAPGTVLARDHRSLRNIPMPNQRSLDLPRLDPEPAHLHLRIRTPQELQHPVTTPARQVPGAVHPASRNTERVRDKPFRRQPRTAHIATRKTRPRNVKLPAHTSRYRLQTTVQNVDLRVPDSAPDEIAGPRSSKLAIEQQVTDMHRRFGDAIHIDQGGGVIRVALVPTFEPPGVQRFATKDHVTQGETPSEFRTLPIRLQQLIERRRSLIENGDALARHQHQKFWRGAADRIRYDHQTTTVEKRSPNFPDGKVKGERMKQGPDIKRAEMKQMFGGTE